MLYHTESSVFPHSKNIPAAAVPKWATPTSLIKNYLNINLNKFSIECKKVMLLMQILTEILEYFIDS